MKTSIGIFGINEHGKLNDAVFISDFEREHDYVAIASGTSLIFS
jgi:hypothetical protein